MQFNVVHGSLAEQPADVVVVNLFEGVTEPGGGTGAINSAIGGAISEMIAAGEFEGKLGQVETLRVCGELPVKRVLLVGLGKSEEFDLVRVMKAAASAARKCVAVKALRVTSILHGAGIAGLPARECARAVVQGTILGAYEYRRLKTDESGKSIESFTIVESDARKIDDIRSGIELGEIVGGAITWSRDIINEPSNYVDPPYLARVAEETAAEFGFDCHVWDRRGLEEAGFGLVAAVSRGSAIEPRFIMMKYNASGAKKTVAIVGKGVTFDAGGYSLKSSEGMYGMKDDMSGAGAVLGVMRAVGRLRPKVNVLMVVPAVENLIGDRAIHPGDVFRSYSGKTVEVNNTDAEGRLILADAVAFAREQGADEIIDLATLTGACVVALGRRISGLYATSDQLAERLISAGRSNGEELWRLPLYADYKEHLKSDVADYKNAGGRDGGSINGALFIGEFVGDTTWAHIDLSSAVADKDTDLARKGATGMGVGTLVDYLMNLE